MYQARALVSVVVCLLIGAIGLLSMPALGAGSAKYYAPSKSLPLACGRPNSQTLRSIVRVATDSGSFASGVVVDHNYVLTAAHAVQGAGHFFVRIDDHYRSADLVMVDHVNDLAMLAVNTLNLTPLLVNKVSPKASDTVWAVGYPRAQPLTASSGALQQFIGNVLHTSASINPGQSGGGLLGCSNGRWSLVGMLRGYGAYLKGDQYVKLQNHSVSVSGATIDAFLQHD